jgi:Glycosyltransferase family 87
LTLERRRLALALACVFYALVAAWVAWTRSATDYPVYLLSARGFLDGENVYAWREREFTAAAAALGIECRAWPYLYPPLTAMIVAPLLALPYRWGLLVWSLVNGFAVVATGRVLGGLARDERTRLAIEVGTWLFCPFWASLYAGQVNPIVTLLAALAVVAALRRRDVLAGLCVGVSLLLKPLAVGVAAYAAWRSRWKLVAALTFAAAGILAASALWLGPDVLHFAGSQVGWSARTPAPSQNLASTALRWLSANDVGPALLDRPLLASIAGMLSAFALTGATLLLCRPRGARPWSRAQIALVIVAIVIANPRTWYHHYTMTAIPLALLASRPSARPRLWWTALGAAYGLITLFGLGWHRLLAHPKILDLATGGGLILWVMSAWKCWRQAQTEDLCLRDDAVAQGRRFEGSRE